MAAGSAAEAAKLLPGDRVISIDSRQLHDVIDYQFYLEPGANDLEIERENRHLIKRIILGDDCDAGISFSSAVFDRIRTCRCDCVFCFVGQLPRGLRKSLYLRDDDFRLSFLYGNFITLGNLSEEDIQRIIGQRLSPLHVSVHATDPDVRGALMGLSAGDAATALHVLRRLGEASIQTHIQIVCCPGANDGAILERTVSELAYDFSGVGSVGVVPVAVDPEYVKRRGRSGRRGARTVALREVRTADCDAVIEAVARWQEKFRGERSAGFVYAADEFYLKSGRPLPPIDYYDDFPQYQNGIGIAASFEREAENVIAESLGAGGRAGRTFLLSGTLAAGQMQNICERLTVTLKRDIRRLVVENRLFGPYVTVAGLLGGSDILQAASSAGLEAEDKLVIPHFCLDSGDAPRFLDDMTLEELREALGCSVSMA